MENWEPVRFHVGELVVDVDRPKWGIGKIVEDRTPSLRPSAKGQTLTIEFEHRGRVIVFTAMRVLQRYAIPD